MPTTIVELLLQLMNCSFFFFFVLGVFDSNNNKLSLNQYVSAAISMLISCNLLLLIYIH